MEQIRERSRKEKIKEEKGREPKPNDRRMIPRIIGGEPIDPTERPFLLEMRSYGSLPFCGAFLLSASVALTAAHCVSPLPPLPLSVSTPACGSSIVERSVSHPSYDASSLRDDIAVLFLSSRMEDCLPSFLSLTDGPPPSESALVAGHGSVDADRFVRPSLPHQARVPLVDDSVCEERWSYTYPDTGERVEYVDSSKQICAGDASVDSCFGDSGSPLFLEVGSPSRIAVLGITSFGAGCADPYFPAVYTRVSSYLSWIESTIVSHLPPSPPSSSSPPPFRSVGLRCDCPPLSPTCLSVSSSPSFVWSVCPSRERREVTVLVPPSPPSFQSPLSLLLPHSIPFHGDVLPSSSPLSAERSLSGEVSFLPRSSSSLSEALLSLNATLLSTSSTPPERETGCVGLEEGFQETDCCDEDEDEVCLSASDLYGQWSC